MLLELSIKDFVIIDYQRIKLDQGLSILTGETGSGKSVVIDALALCLGERGSKNLVRKDRQKAIIEAVFWLEEPLIDLEFESIDIIDSKEIIITREIFSDGKSISRVNSRNVNLNILKKLGSKLMHIHGQHENHSLLNKENFILLLDEYGKKEILDFKNNYVFKYNQYKNIQTQIDEILKNRDEKELLRELDLLKFQIDEIKKAQLDEEENEILEKKLEIFRNQEKIFESIKNSNLALYQMDNNVYDILGNVLKFIKSVQGFDKKIDEFEERIENIYYETREVSYDMSSYIDSINFDVLEFQNMELRMDEINNLKRKYGNTISEILKYQYKMEEKLDLILNRDERLNLLNKDKELLVAELQKLAQNLSQKRKEVAILFEEAICAELKDLNAPNVEFKVEFLESNNYQIDGKDQLDFLINFNKGENLQSISKIASGGEMSRFMLAFNSVLSEIEGISTLVFDEIDTGISGITAQRVGEKLKELSTKKQIICITHLPQIAMVGDHHYCIEKHVKDEKTISIINFLDSKGKVLEVARLMGGEAVGQKTLDTVEELIENTKNIY